MCITLRRFSFNKYVATGTGTCACTCNVLSLMASSSIKRRTDNANDSIPRTWPVPLQRGQTFWLVSPIDGRKR